MTSLKPWHRCSNCEQEFGAPGLADNPVDKELPIPVCPECGDWELLRLCDVDSCSNTATCGRPNVTGEDRVKYYAHLCSKHATIDHIPMRPGAAPPLVKVPEPTPEAESIVTDLALADPVALYPNPHRPSRPLRVCTLCEMLMPAYQLASRASLRAAELTAHQQDCPWRRAVELLGE